MSLKLPSWVQEDVRDLYTELYPAQYSGDEDRRASAVRLVTDDRMREVYGSAYLNRRFTKQGWRIWFDVAHNIRPDELRAERDRLKEYVELVGRLAQALEEAASIMAQMDELGVAEARTPLELYDPLILLEAAAIDPSGQLSTLFGNRIKPKLDAFRNLEVDRYLPSVPRMVAVLADRLSEYENGLKCLGPSSAYKGIEAALASRQHSPLAEYVRCFDKTIGLYAWEIGGNDFQFPPDILAIQAAVALNLNIVDKKQIVSARKLIVLGIN
ncbi:MAG TPA: hypothetical protein VFF81_01800 [Noviherbaspirillum sp.]|nr:hypothetical protein [Noviherbaspirillum sp.]